MRSLNPEALAQPKSQFLNHVRYTLQYIAWNPIKAGLASSTGYPWFILRNDIRESGGTLTLLEIMERLLWDDPKKVPDFLEMNDQY